MKTEELPSLTDMNNTSYYGGGEKRLTKYKTNFNKQDSSYTHPKNF